MTLTSPGKPLDLVIVGHVTRDLIGPDVRLGGAASFAARAASCLGLRTGLVTAAPIEIDLLAPLRQDPNIELLCVAAHEPTTFELDYSGPTRRVYLRARAPQLAASDIPPHFRDAPMAFVAPVAGECGADVVRAFPEGRVIVGAQGWLRAFADDGTVIPDVCPEAESPPEGLSLVVFSELDHPDADAIAQRFADHGALVALTRGADGATLYSGSDRLPVAADEADEIDPTGAGDVYGLVLGMALRRDMGPIDAARLAAVAAARVVEGPGMGRLPEFYASRSWQDLVAA